MLFRSGPNDSTSSSAGKIKSYSIPQLQADGTNWIMWKQQTLNSLMSNKGVQWDIEGMARTPPAIPTYPPTHTLSDDVLKTGFRGCSYFGFWILRDLASTYVLRRPCSLSLYFGISRSSGWLDLVVNKERNLSQFQN